MTFDDAASQGAMASASFQDARLTNGDGITGNLGYSSAAWAGVLGLFGDPDYVVINGVDHQRNPSLT